MDYYSILGVARDADSAAIKKAFHSLALTHHPDKGGDEERFKQIREAYETLMDATKRRQYDMQQQPFFLSLATNRKPKSPAWTKPVRIDMIDLYKGTALKVAVHGEYMCNSCEGSGTLLDKPPSCTACGGCGFVIHSHHLAFLVHRTQIPCTTCTGRGICFKPEDQCMACSGNGYIFQTREMNVQVPAGTFPDEWITLPNVGPCNRGCTPGDVSILVKQRDHANFVRDGIHLTTTVKVPLVTALAGGPVSINLIARSSISFNASPGDICPGLRRCLPGQGFPIKGTKQFGNLYIVFEVEWPESLSPATIKALALEASPMDDRAQPLASLERC